MVNASKAFLTAEESDRVRAAVRDAEAKSSGEIRVIIVGRSTPRSRLIPLLLGLIAGLAAFKLLHDSSWGYPGILEWLGSISICAVTAVAAWFFLPPSMAAKSDEVRRRAEREFLSLGMGKTREGTGVLVMLSLYERLATVLADRGINEKVPPDTWAREVAAIVDGVKGGTAGDGLCRAVNDIGDHLAKHFPRRHDDTNELPDDVVTK